MKAARTMTSTFREKTIACAAVVCSSGREHMIWAACSCSLFTMLDWIPQRGTGTLRFKKAKHEGDDLSGQLSGSN